MDTKELVTRGKELLKAGDPSAITCFEQAVENGNAKANYYLATIYRFGKGVTVDMDKAIDLYKAAAKAGSNPALYQLGKLSETGRGKLKKSKEEAKKYYLEAAQHGYTKAMLELSKIYEKEFDTAKAREENNNKRAIKIINENRKPNNANKANGEEVEVVYSVESDISNAEAVKWLEAYVEKTEDHDATLHLAYFYEIGKGIVKDDDKAIELYTKIANEGDEKIILKLAKKYQNEGKAEEAIHWYTKLFEKGDDKAAYQIALIYEGLGDKYETKNWYHNAADMGNYDAKHKIAISKEKPVTFIVGQDDNKF